MIVIVDYACGNIASVLNMIRKAGGDAIVSDSHEVIKQATKLILPGVGAYDHGMSHLHAKQLPAILQDRAAAGVPLLGICLGMQLLAQGSEEGKMPGLGLIDAKFKRFAFEADSTMRVPHVGWNTVQIQKSNPLIPDNQEENRYYFVHSYYAACADESDILTMTEYGHRFPSAYSKENVYGVQFHPEKSHRFGLSLIKQFLKV
ncbi:MAG: imidazole glycerol phosphate synthase subunit HisH [Polaromonas sp.]|nr:imidazole glycerol phosphate synthase subunit HisH [Polaromonas sp.]